MSRKYWVVYTQTSGAILRVGSCPLEFSGVIEDLVEPLAVCSASEAKILSDGYVTGKTHYVSNGVIESYTEDEIKLLDSPPSEFHIWVPINRQWEISTEDQQKLLERIKQFKMGDILDERERRNSLPVTVNGITFDADQQGQRNVQAWMTMLNSGVSLPSGFVWRDSSNVDHPADEQFIKSLALAITMRGTEIYGVSWQLKAQVEAATSQEELAAISWPA